MLSCLLLALSAASAADEEERRRGFFSTPPSPTSIRTTEYGKIVGYMDGNDRERYMGIPFAAPPTGNNRFRAPQEHPGWTGVRKCEEISLKRKCITPDAGREDCLYLDVHVPSDSDGEKLPVWVWIYGGGFIGGDKNEGGFYDPHAIMDDHRVVFVALNYRLDTFGFMAHPAFEAESEPGSVSGNYGLLDQTFALKWVQKNIANFNGDPDNVMIFGQSAGGMSVEFQVVSPVAKGTFKTAVILSGPPDVAFWQPKAVANQWALDWAEKAGCGQALGDQERIRDCLRSQEPSKLMESRLAHPSKLSLFYPLMGWMPNIDGYYLTNTPVGMVQAGNWNKVPTMFGVEKDEGTVFVLGTPAIVPGTFPMSYDALKSVTKQVYPYNVTKQKMVYDHYYQQSGLFEKWYWAKDAANAMYTDAVVRCGTRRMMRAIAAQNLPTAPTYYYYTNYDAPLMAGYQALGDFHGFDLVHVFEFDNLLTQVWTPSNTALGKFLRKSYYEFAQFGTPGHAKWDPYTLAEEKGIYMDGYFGSQNMNKNDAECDFWDSLGPNMWKGQTGFDFVPSP